MTSIPASRSARAMILAPRSCPSKPGFATTTRIFFSVEADIDFALVRLGLHERAWIVLERGQGRIPVGRVTGVFQDQAGRRTWLKQVFEIPARPRVAIQRRSWDASRRATKW